MRWLLPRRAGLQTNLKLTIALLGVGLVALTVIQVTLMRQSDLSTAATAVSNLSGSLSEQAQGTFQTAEAVLYGLVEHLQAEPSAALNTLSLQRMLEQRVQSLSFLEGLTILRQDGHVLAASSPDLVVDGAAPAASQPFQHHRDDPSPAVFVGAPVRSRPGGPWVITLSRRLEHRDGSFAGIVMADIATDFFQRFYERFDVGARGVIMLARDDGTLLVRRPFSAPNVGRDLSRSELFARHIRAAALAQQIAGAPVKAATFGYVSSIDGLVRLGSFKRVEGTGLLVVAALERKAVFGEWRRVALLQGLGLVLLLAALGALGRKLLRQVAAKTRAQRSLIDNHMRLLKAEAVSGEARAQLELAEQIAHVGHWQLSLPSREVSWSDEVYRIYGVDKKQFTLSLAAAIDAYHPDDRAIVLDAIERSCNERVGFDITVRLIRPSGELRFVQSRGRVQIRSGGPPLTLFGTFVDVTEQKTIEAELTAARQDAEAANRALADLAMRDEMTGLANRRAFDQALDREFRRAMRNSGSLGLIMIDVDHFKQFNDLYGHPSGDACLRAIADAILPLVKRPGDMAARYGGEEMAVLLPGIDVDGARTVAETIVQAIRNLRIPHAQAVSGPRPFGIVTISAGVEAIQPAHNHDLPAELVQRADVALYAAKRSGRNTVRCYGEIHPHDNDVLVPPRAQLE